MKNNMRRDIKMRGTVNKILVVLMVFSIMGFGGYAFAAQETGYGPNYRGWGYYGHGWHHGEDRYPGYGYMMGNLSEKEIQQMDAQREAFFKSTEDLRQKIYQKRLALESEFAKKNPDVKNAENLQKEISDLKAKIDQKRIEYLLNIKKINPNFGTGWMRPGRMGYGPGWMGRGYGMGYGPGRMGYGNGGRFRGNGPMGYGPFTGHPCWQ
jgi:zinc resistance-associated protein